jgi:hypothetical protein
MAQANYLNGDDYEFDVSDAGVATFTNAENPDLTLEGMYTAILTEMGAAQAAVMFEFVQDEVTNTFVLYGDGLAGVQNSDIMVELVGVSDTNMPELFGAVL